MREEFKQITREVNKGFLRFFLIFVFAGGVFGGILFFVFFYESEGFMGELLAKERLGVHLRKELIEQDVATVLADVEYLSLLDVLNRYINKRESSLLEPLSQELLAFANSRSQYDQIRLLDRSGMELVRVARRDGRPVVLPEVELQDKGQRYYFKDTIMLEPGAVYASPLDLNVEHGEVEIPYKPMIRFGTPLYDASGRAVGVLMINYRADRLFNLLRRTGILTHGQTMLLNSNGYWLLAPDSADQWGFMFPEKTGVNFGARYPEPWAGIKDSERGQIVTLDSVFTYVTIRPLTSGVSSSSGTAAPAGDSSMVLQGEEYYWKLISFVPDVASGTIHGWAIGRMLGMGALLAGGAGVSAWLIAFLFVRRGLYRRMTGTAPLRDEVTGLVNERLYRQRLESAVERAGETGVGFSLLRVLVDDLATINHTYGKDVGDGLLLQMALRLKADADFSDTVARLGEDEFVILRLRVNDRASLDDAVSKTRHVLDEPYKLYESLVSVGVSVTAGLYPNDAHSPERLLIHLRRR